MGDRLFQNPRLCLLILQAVLTAILGAQEGPVFQVTPPGERWTVITRWDYRVRMDGAYLGFANRELREVYAREEEVPGGWIIEGEARLLGSTKKDGRPVAARLEGSDSVAYLLEHDGTVSEADDAYPSLRGFPTFPRGVLEIGDRWEAPIDILILGPDGEKGVSNQIASYQYLGRKPYMGMDAYYFDVSWAIRHREYNPSTADFLKDVEGSHKVSLVMDAETLAPIMARDQLSERWEWADSRVEQRDGFALIFWDGVPPLDFGGIRKEFETHFQGHIPPGAEEGGSEHPGVVKAGENDDLIILETDRGVSVTLRNLHFRPDLAVLLPSDRPVLDDLAGILNSIPDRTVLVRGHTADVGRPDDEHALSEERARTISDELAGRGVDPRRLIYEGVGADEPLSPNDSEEGRRRNRRVELIILED